MTLEVVVEEFVGADRQNPEIAFLVGVYHQRVSADLVLVHPLVRVSVDLFCLGIEAAKACGRVGPQLSFSIFVEVEDVVVR